jgi:hypothetical protein
MPLKGTLRYSARRSFFSLPFSLNGVKTNSDVTIAARSTTAVRTVLALDTAIVIIPVRGTRDLLPAGCAFPDAGNVIEILLEPELFGNASE